MFLHRPSEYRKLYTILLTLQLTHGFILHTAQLYSVQGDLSKRYTLQIRGFKGEPDLSTTLICKLAILNAFLKHVLVRHQVLHQQTWHGYFLLLHQMLPLFILLLVLSVLFYDLQFSVTLYNGFVLGPDTFVHSNHFRLVVVKILLAVNEVLCVSFPFYRVTHARHAPHHSHQLSYQNFELGVICIARSWFLHNESERTEPYPSRFLVSVQ